MDDETVHETLDMMPIVIDYLDNIVHINSKKLLYNYLYIPRIYLNWDLPIPIEIIHYISSLMVKSDENYHDYILNKWFKDIDEDNICPCPNFTCIKYWYELILDTKDDFTDDLEWRHCSTSNCHQILWTAKNGSFCEKCCAFACDDCTIIPLDNDSKYHKESNESIDSNDDYEFICTECYNRKDT